MSSPRTPGAVVLGLLAFLALAPAATAAAPFPAGSTFLVSRPDGSAPLPAATDGNSELSGSQAMSEDGTRVVFTSRADDLFADDSAHAYLEDTTTGAVTLLDRAGPSGPVSNGYAGFAAISRDGSTACFLSNASNLGTPDDGGETEHVYVVTLATGAIELVDRANGASGTVGNNSADDCSLDADGRMVAFASRSYNLLGANADLNGAEDIFVRDLSNETNKVQSSDGATLGDSDSYAPVLDASGQTVAFESFAANLLGPGVDANGHEDVFERSFIASQPTLVSRADGASGAQGTGSSANPSISDDGGAIAFDSLSDNLGDGATGTTDEVHVRVGNSTILASRADGAAGAAGDRYSEQPALSGDGTVVAFTSTAGNLGVAPNQSSEGPESRVWVRTLPGNASPNHTELLARSSAPAGDPGNAFSETAALDGDGNRAVFGSDDSNLADGANSLFDEVLLRDRTTSTTSLLSRPQAGGTRPSQVSQSNIGPVDAVSADGRFVVFSSEAPLLGTPAGGQEVLVRDTLLGTTQLVSRATGADGAVADGYASDPIISADGSTVAFTSDGDNLGVANPSRRSIVYVRRLATATTTAASLTPSGQVSDGGSQAESIDRDGGVVAFTSNGDDLVTGDTNDRTDAFVHDVAGGGTQLVDLASDGTEATFGADTPRIDADGKKVAFLSQGANLPGSGNSKSHAYLRDLTAGATTQVDFADGAGGAPAKSSGQGLSISDDGNRVAFISGDQLAPGAVSTDGSTYVRDIAAGTTTIASVGSDGVANNLQTFSPAISGDGTKVAFEAQDANFPASGGLFGQIYERDLTAHTTTLISAVNGGTVGGNNGAEYASLDRDGGCAAFMSYASSLVSDGYGPSIDFSQVFERAAGGACPVLAPVAGPGLLPGSAPGVVAAGPPTLAGVSLSARTFRVGPKKTAVAAKAKKNKKVPVGTTLRFKLSEAATVKIAVTQTRKLKRKHKKARTVTTTRVTFSRKEKLGAGTFAFSGRWGKHKLAPGKYHFVVVATDAAKRSSKKTLLAFTVVR